MSRGGDDICPMGFAPHSVRPTRCKRCFRDYSEHKKRGEKEIVKPAIVPPPPTPPPPPPPDPPTPPTPPPQEQPSTSTAVVRRRRPRPIEVEEQVEDAATTRRRVRTRPGSWSYSSTESVPETKEERAEEERRSTLPTDAGDGQQVNSPDVEFILHVKQQRARDTEEDEDALSTAPTETTITMVQDGGSSDDALAAKVRQMSERCAQLEREKRQLERQRRSTESESEVLEAAAAELLTLRAQLFELRTRNEDCNDENASLRLEVQELKQDLDARPKQLDVRRAVTELEGKLHAAEALCEELMDENEAMKREMRDMEDELDEMQDNFREEQADEYRDLKKELEQASKNCRILQFKLRKSERRSEQLELDNAALHQKVAGQGQPGDAVSAGGTERLAQLQAELTSARQVAVQMHTEMQQLKENLAAADNQSTQSSKEVEGGLPALPQLRGHPDGGSNKDDPAQLLRELCDSVERERDLREQLKFSEEEAKSLRNKLTRVEEENESLVMQMKKMASSGKQSRFRRVGDQTPDDSDPQGQPEGPSCADLKLQLELNEQETLLLRKKLQESSEDNDKLRAELTLSQERLEGFEKATRTQASPATQGSPEGYIELDMDMLRQEATELRRKILGSERENESLKAQLDALRGCGSSRRGSKAQALTQRSKSLDGDVQLDLRRQLQLVEQEASILRQKVEELEGDNDRLVAENRTLQLRPASAAAKKTKPKSGISEKQKTVPRVEAGTQTDAGKERDEADGKMTTNELAAGQKLLKAEKKVAELLAALKEAEETKNKLQQSLDETRKQLEADKEKLKLVDTRQSEVAVGWLKERGDLKKQLQESQKMLEVEQQRSKDREASLTAELSKKNSLTADGVERRERELKSQKELVEQLRGRVADGELRVLQAEGAVREAEDTCRRERETWRSERLDMEAQVKAERKSRERAERDHEDELRDRDEDILRLRDRAKKAEAESKRHLERSATIEEEMRDRFKGLERELAREKQEYDDLTTKYDMLEEDYVVTKAQLVMDREKVESNYNALKRLHSEAEGELKTLRETFNVRQDTWIKEKLDMQERIKELLGKLSRSGPALSDINKERFKEILDEKTSLVEQLKKEDRLLRDDIDRLKRQTEDQRKMLEDYERLQSFGSRNMGGDSERQLRQMQDTIAQAEKRFRSELTSLKMQHEQRVAALADEVHASQSQLGKLLRERDTYREMLDGAKKTIAELKSGSIRGGGGSTAITEIQELKRQVDEAREAKVALQDQLDDALRSSSKLSMELFTEKLRAAETQTKLNELEETTILQGGKSRIFGVKTKLELAWQKEREEQHRLLNEAHKMATDMKQRLLAVEGLRDQERLEAKRTVDDLRRAVEEERTLAESRTHELRGDLVDLRDNLTKMRGAHERVRRERDRSDREKEDLRAMVAEIREADDLQRAVFAALIEQLRNMEATSQALIQAPSSSSKKAEAEKAKNDFRDALHKVEAVAEEIRRSLQAEDERRANRARALAAKRTTTDTGSSDGTVPRRSQLNRKSLSLDQNLAAEAAIWKSAEAAPSVSSMSTTSERPTPSPRMRRSRNPPITPSESVESDVSDSSLAAVSVTDSEVSASSGKKSSMRHVLRRLTKSKSVEATSTGDQIARAGVQAMGPGLGPSAGSVAEMPQPEKDKKRTREKSGDASPTPSLKSKLSGLFRRTPSRSSSVERSDADLADSRQRPSTLPRFGGSTGALQLHRVHDRK